MITEIIKKVSLLSAHNLWFEHKDRVAAPVLIHVGVHCYRIIYATWRLVFLSLSLQDLVKSVTASCSFLKRLTLPEIRWIYSDFLKGLRDTGSFGMTSIFNKLLTALWDPIARTWTRERERQRERERCLIIYIRETKKKIIPPSFALWCAYFYSMGEIFFPKAVS